MTFDNMVTLISSVGFPIAIATYMILKVDKTINSLHESVIQLIGLIEKEIVKHEDDRN